MKLKNILVWVITAGLFVVPFIAFMVPNSFFFPFITGKGFAFRILVESLFGLFVVLAFIDKEYRPKLSWVTKSIIFFIVAILVADLLGQNPYKSLWSNYERMEGFVLMINLAMYYITLSSVFKTNGIWNKLFNTSIVASFLMSVYGFFQLVGKLTINQGGVRLDATFGNASYLAIYLVFHIFLCLYMLFTQTKQKWLQWTYSLVAVFETVILYYTATRGAILGLVGGLLLSGIIVIWKEKENKVLRKSAIWIIGVVVVLVLGFIALRSTPFVQKSPVLSRFSTLGITEFQSQGRYFIWPMAIKGALERPLFGWGQENFNFVFNKYYNPHMFGQEEWFDRTHNIILDWLIAGGLVGLLAYASMYLAMFYYVWRKESVLSLAGKSIFTGMIAAYVFNNMFVFDNLISYIIFFSLLAFIHSVSTIKKEEKGKFYTKTFSNDVLYYIIIPIILILTTGVVYFVNVPAILANQTLIQAISPQGGDIEKSLASFKQVYAYDSFGSGEATEQLISMAFQVASSPLPDATKQEFYNFASQKIIEKVASSPTDARYLVFAGSFFNRFGNYDDGVSYLTRALVQSPKKQSIIFELGSSYIGKKDFPKAAELFKEAYDLDPTVPESIIINALGAIYTNNTILFKEMSSQIDPGVIVSDARFLKAYADVGDYTSVINILNTRLSKDPTYLQDKLSLASAYATIGQKQKAISLIQEMIAQEPSFKAQGEQYIQQIGQ